MTDHNFTARLEHAYRRPANEVDAALLTAAVLAALDRADRRRRVVLTAAAAAGASVTVAGVLGLGAAHSLAPLVEAASAGFAWAGRTLGALPPTPWSFALVGAVLAVSAVARTVEDF